MLLINTINEQLKKHNLILLCVGIILWPIAILKSNANYGEYGLITSLSPVYYICFITVASYFIYIKEQSIAKRFLVLLFIVLILWVTPQIIEGTARREWCYINYSFADYVVRHGHINPAGINMWYHNWPLYSLLISEIVTIINLDTVSSNFFFIFPFILILFYIPFVYLIIRRHLNNYSVWLAMLLFVLGSWTGQEYLSPQGLGYLLLLMILYLLLKDNNKNVACRILVLICFISIITSHLLTAVVGLLMISLISFRDRKDLLLIIIFCTILGAWTIHGSSNYFDKKFPQFFREALKIDLIFENNLKERIGQGSNTHSITASTKLIYSFAYWILALVGMAKCFVKDKVAWKDDKMLSYLFFIPFFLIPVFVYGGELYIRVFFLSLLFSVCFIAKLFPKIKILPIILIIALMLPARIVAQYGNEMLDFVPLDYLKANAFVVTHIESGTIIGSPPIGKIYNAENYSTLHPSLVKWQDILNADKKQYIAIGRRDSAWQTLIKGNRKIIEETLNALSDNDKTSAFYESKNIRLYMLE